MRIKNVELIIFGLFIFLEILSFISIAIPVRFAGQNVLNYRLWANLLLIIIIFTDSKILVSKSTMIVYLYLSIFLILETMGHYDLQGNRTTRLYWISQQHIPLLVSVVLSERFYKDGDSFELRMLLRIAIFAYIIASIASMYATYRFPQAVRGNAVSYYSIDQSIYRKFGLGGLDFFSGLPFLIPVLVYRYKKATNSTSFTRLFWLATIILVTVCIYTGAIVAPILVTVVMLFLSLMGRKRFRSNVSLLVLLAMVLLIIPKSFIGSNMYGFSKSIHNTEISRKVSDLGLFISEGVDVGDIESGGTENSIEGRFLRAPANIRVFFRNPFIGTGKLDQGMEGNEHIFWLNLFAQFGIVGAFPLIWLYYYNIRRNLAKYDDEYRYYYLVSITGFIALGFMKVLLGWFMYLVAFFIVPNMYYFEKRKATILSHPVIETSNIGKKTKGYEF